MIMSVSEDWRIIIVCFLHNRAGGISARDRKLIKVLRAVSLCGVAGLYCDVNISIVHIYHYRERERERERVRESV